VDIGAALGKPFGNIKNLVIGIILMLIPIVNILTIPGYMIRVANRTMSKDNSLPGFDNFGELVVDSIKYIVIGIIYLIPSLVVFAIALGSVFMSVLNAATLTGAPEAAQAQVMQAIGSGLAAAAGLVVLGIIVAILCAILAVSGIMNYAATKQFGKAFAIMENLKNFFTGGFIVAIIVAIVLWIVVSAVLGMIAGALALAGVAIVGTVIMIIVIYALDVALISLLAEGYPQGAAPAAAPTAAMPKA